MLKALLILSAFHMAPALAAPFSAACEAALVAGRDRAAHLFENQGVELSLLGPNAGLISDQLVTLTSPAERDIFLQSQKKTRDDVRATLQSLTLNDFASHVFVVSSLGVSQWSKAAILPVGEARLVDWKTLNGTPLQDWFDQGLLTSGHVRGLNPLVQLELKTSVRMAIRAARIVRNPNVRKRLIWLEDGLREGGLVTKSANEIFRYLLEIEAVRGIGKTPNEIKETLAFGGRLRHHGRHKLMLPFRYQENAKGRMRLKMNKADQLHLRAIALRFTHLKQLVIGSERRQLSDEHALFLAVFPEFTGVFTAMKLSGMELYLGHLDQIIDNSSRYQFELGEVKAFWWDLVFLKFLHTDLKAQGIGSIHLNLYVGRDYDPLNEELSDINIQVDVSPYDLDGNKIHELSLEQRRAIVSALARELPEQRIALSVETVEPLTKNRSLFQLKAVKSARSESTALIEAFFTLQEMTFSAFAEPSDE